MKKFLYGLLALIALVLIVAAIMPRSYNVIVDIIVDKPKDQVRNYVKLLKNQPTYSVRYQTDPNQALAYSGIDGTVGFTQTRSGNKEVGVGEQTITQIAEGEYFEVLIHFMRPMEWKNTSRTSVESFSPTQTRVVNTFEWSDPWPLNIVSLCFKPVIRKDMIQNMNNLKKVLESN